MQTQRRLDPCLVAIILDTMSADLVLPINQDLRRNTGSEIRH